MKTTDHSLLNEVSLELEEIRRACKIKATQEKIMTSYEDSSSSSSSKRLMHVAKSSTYEFTGKYSGMDLEKDNNAKITHQNQKSEKVYDVSSNLTDHKFPPGCLKLLFSLPGNNCCVDCGKERPDWASVSYGILLCLQCSGRHRGFGVQVSFVRSVSMDSWSHSQILAMLEGGNEQLNNFFCRHSLSPPISSSKNINQTNVDLAILEKRYRTKAALFYRQQLGIHVKKLISDGKYKGREAARKNKSVKNRNDQSSSASRVKEIEQKSDA